MCDVWWYNIIAYNLFTNLLYLFYLLFYYYYFITTTILFIYYSYTNTFFFNKYIKCKCSSSLRSQRFDKAFKLKAQQFIFLHWKRQIQEHDGLFTIYTSSVVHGMFYIFMLFNIIPNTKVGHVWL